MEEGYWGASWLVRAVLYRGFAAIYLIAFIVALRQFPALLGERGLLPVPEFLKRVSFSRYPSLFFFFYSDRVLKAAAILGAVLSAASLAGLPELGHWWAPLAVWLTMWALYLSIVNVGQEFYGFGWETMLLEAGFLTAFLGSSETPPSLVPILLLRWMLFRTEVGAGLIKLRHDTAWRDLTALVYHYETQPLPNPLSWFFHRAPVWFHKTGVAFSHLVQVIVPFGLFAPQPAASIAAALIILHQGILIVSGNYSWLNWMTVVLGLSGFGHQELAYFIPVNLPLDAALDAPLAYRTVAWLLGAAGVFLSIAPAKNLLSRHQLMNHSFNRLHLINAYGAFGSITRTRYELIVEGASEGSDGVTGWREYGFIAKPGDIKRKPPQIAPYHLRLDWMMWFLPFSVLVLPDGIAVEGYDRWFLRFVEKLLHGDEQVLRLMREDPFGGVPPRAVRVLFYRYEFTTLSERRKSGAWWKRELIGDYLPSVNLHDLQRYS